MTPNPPTYIADVASALDALPPLFRGLPDRDLARLLDAAQALTHEAAHSALGRALAAQLLCAFLLRHVADAAGVREAREISAAEVAPSTPAVH